MEGRNFGDLLLDYALSTGLTSRPTAESQQKSWFQDGYRYFVSKKTYWWFLKSSYTCLTDSTNKVPLPLDFRAFTYPNKIKVGDIYYDLIAQNEVDRHTVAGTYPVALPVVGRPRLCYVDESDMTLNFLSAPGTGLTVTMKYVRNVGRVRKATAQTGASTTITLDSSASSQNDVYNGMKIRIISGTGSGQVRTISDYVGSTKVATVSQAWTTAPGVTSEFVIGDVIEVDADIPSMPDEFREGLIQYGQYRRWSFLTEPEQAQFHLDKADLIIASAASENGKKKFGTGEARYSG